MYIYSHFIFCDVLKYQKKKKLLSFEKKTLLNGKVHLIH